MLGLHFAFLKYCLLFYFVFCVDGCGFLIIDRFITDIEAILGGICSSRSLIDLGSSWSACLPQEPSFLAH